MAVPPAKVVTRGYRLLSLPANRVRVASDWVLDAALPRQSVQLGLVRGSAVPLSTADPGAPRDFAAVSGGRRDPGQLPGPLAGAA